MNLIRHLAALSAATIALTIGGAASAAVVNFTLTPALGAVGAGTGTLTTTNPISNSGLVTIFSANLSFTIGGNTFATTTGSASFLNGSLFNLTFAQLIGQNPNRFNLVTAGTTYAYSYNNLLLTAPGTITVAQSTAAVPEPATWAMMVIGFGAVGFAMRRRGKVAASVRFA